MIEMVLMATTAAAMQVAEGPERSAILDAARVPVTEALKKPVRFEVRHLKRSGDWAFLLATMVEPSGAPLDYASTPMAAPAAQGYMSRSYMALLRRQDGGWTVIDKAIGPSDVPWALWAKRHSAPPAIFPAQ
ncbi:hypothetical protein DMC47_41505 [Nostoc sp. 3335mG]|nr:hypothetical protein DMC47_41505 [Nostoc sp. 3335mG]